MTTSGIRFGLASWAVFCLLAGCERNPSARAPEAAPTPEPPAQGLIPALPDAPVLAPPPLPSSIEKPSTAEEFQSVCSMEWTLTPQDAVLHVWDRKSDAVHTADQGRVALTLASGFYSVEITAPGFRPWKRRMALDASTPAMNVSLAPLPPEVPTAPPPPEPDVTQSQPAPYFPKNSDLRKLELSERFLTEEPPEPQSAPDVTSPAPSEEPIRVVAAAPLVVPLPIPAVAAPLAEPTAEEAPAVTEPAILEPVVTVPIATAPVVTAPVVTAPIVQPHPLEDPTPAPVAVSIPEELPPPVVTPAPVPPAPKQAPTRWVRILLESTLPNDTVLASTPKTLSFGTSIRSISGLEVTLPFTELANQPLLVQARDYKVLPPTLLGSDVPLPSSIVPATLESDTLTIRFKAAPHCASLQLPKIPASAEVWDLSTNLPRPDYAPATRTLSALYPFTQHSLQIRAQGMRPQPIVVDPLTPKEVLSSDVEVLPLPVYGSKAERCILDAGSGCDLELIWVPGGPVNTASGPKALSRGFWITAQPVTRRQWLALSGHSPADASDTPMELAYPLLAPVADALTANVPRLSVRLPLSLELLRAKQVGLSSVAPASELSLPSQPGTQPARAAGAFHLVFSMSLPALSTDPIP